MAAIAAAIAAFEGGAPRRVRVAPIRERAEERAPAAAATPSLWALSGRLAQMAARRELWAKRRG
ncbi:MAG: hypothetical protein IRZ11_08660 [Clostridia bacterium]|nr:hypothetical protein [Clostridia bacterium]